MSRKKRRIPPQDAMFLWGETAETMMHVGALMPFTPPKDASPTYLRDLVHAAREMAVAEPFNLKLSHPHLMLHPLQSWVVDEKFDPDFHIRRSALASPGDERELGVLVSRLHSHQIDFTRPPWEMHVIEGLQGGRFAVYVKVHHALVDGFTAVKMLSRSLSTDPDDDKLTLFFSMKPPARPPAPKQSRSLVKMVTGGAKGAVDVAGAAAGLAKAVVKLELGRGEDHEALKSGRDAPDTMLNRRTSRTRRFATQQYQTERFRAIAKASGGTINDVVMAVCGGGLRRYLSEQDALPKKPLVAFMPVNIRAEGDEGGGNKVAVLLASMATDVADPAERLKAVITSTRKAKKQVSGMGQLPALAYSGYLLAPGLAQTLAAITGVKNPLPTTFNLVLSNVPGPRKPLYLKGSRLEAVYPVSIPAHGMALNITLETYADTLNFGFIGDRDAVPSLQKLAVYTGEALAETEAVLGLKPKKADLTEPTVTLPATARSGPQGPKQTKKAAPKKAAPKKTAPKKTAVQNAAKKPAPPS